VQQHLLGLSVVRLAGSLAGVASLRKLKDSSTKAVCSLQTQMECDCACF